jgi:hypothetical protein
MSWRTDTTVIHLIRIWILVILHNAKLFSVSYCTDILPSNVTNNSVIVTVFILIWLYRSGLKLQLIIYFDCDTSISRQWKESFCNIFYRYAVLYRYQQLGKYYSTCPDTNMRLKIYTEVVYLISMWILVSVDHVQTISLSYLMNMLSSKILTSWWMIHHLSRYKDLVLNW